ncbi:YwqI/YxiC family protein, partial [Bacillus haynesii]
MTTIKLKHEAVIKKLEAVREALDALDLPNPPQAAGKNKLTYTTKCHERE